MRESYPKKMGESVRERSGDDLGTGTNENQRMDDMSIKNQNNRKNENDDAGYQISAIPLA